MTTEPRTPSAGGNVTAPVPAIHVESLVHSFPKHRALTDVSFSVTRQSIHGFVGPNGAGKTTTLKILATLLRHQRGRVSIFGLDVAGDYKAVRRRIGFMPDHFSMYRQMTVVEYLDFFGAAYGLGPVERDRVIDDVLALTDMGGRRDNLIKSLSRGMQQRVSLARVLVHDPDLLLLDEPASGLDPRARIELMEILQELRRLGKTIFISSHILSELATLCDDVTILDCGAVKYTGSMKGLTTNRGDSAAYTLELAEEHPGAEAALRLLPGMNEVSRADGAPRYLLSFQKEVLPVNTIIRSALDSGGRIVSLQEDVKHLNQAFMDLTQPGVRS
jgi:ABC-2 type transport system ATP-binding protein